MPPSQSATTCKQCRARKVRCKGGQGPGACYNCVRLKFDCSLQYPALSSVASTNTRPERKRGSRSCKECRTRKTKCSGELPSCSSCQKRMKECIYPDMDNDQEAKQRPTHTPVSSGLSPTPSHDHSPIFESNTVPANPDNCILSNNDGIVHDISPRHPVFHASNHPQRSPSSFNAEGLSSSSVARLPPLREQLQLITDYFRHIYPIGVYAFLNEVSVTQRCLNEALDETLLLSICALSALQLDYRKYYPTVTTIWIKRAEGTILDLLHEPSFFRTQALLLIVLYRIQTGEFQRAYMLSALGARAASALRLQYERTDLSTSAAETRRRLMWCMAMMEGYFSVGLPECEMCHYDAIYLQLPCPEEEFNADSNEDARFSSISLDGVSESGLLSIQFKLNAIRRDATRLKRQASFATQPMPQLETLTRDFSRTLQQIGVPTYSAEELERFSKSRWLVRYITVQLSCNQCYCDVFRLFMSGYSEAASSSAISGVSADFITESIQSCLRHAEANLQIIQDLANLPALPVVVDNDLAICGYHACRIIIFISQSEANPCSELTPEVAKRKVTEVLLFLRKVFPKPKATLAERLLLELEILVQPHDTINREEGRDSSDLEDGQSRRPRFALAAKKYQDLGIHSVMRQARFVDDSYIAANSSQRNTEEGQHQVTPISLPPAGSVTDSVPGSTASCANNQGFGFSAQLSQSAGLSTGPTEMTMEPLLDDARSFTAGWDTWSDFCFPEEFSSGPDGYYL